MKDNTGKVDLIIVLVIILANALLGFVLWFFFIRDAESPQNNTSGGMTPLQRTEVDHDYGRDDRRDDHRRDDRRDNERWRDSRYDTSSDFGAKDYVKEYTIWDLGDPLTVNPLNAPRSFFVVSISFEIRQADKKLPDELKNKLPLFKDSLQYFFSRLTLEELRDIEMRENYKRDIMRMVNGMLMEGRITNVIFAQWVIQEQ